MKYIISIIKMIASICTDLLLHVDLPRLEIALR